MRTVPIKMRDHWASLTARQRMICIQECNIGGIKSESRIIVWAWEKKQRQDAELQRDLVKARRIINAFNRGFCLVNDREVPKNTTAFGIAESAKNDYEWATKLVARYNWS